MNDTHTSAGLGVLRALHRDQAGTTLTELVIVLPIFVFMFSGILRIYKYEDLSVQAYATSYAQAMDQHSNLQKAFVPDWSISPLTGAGNAVAWHSGAHGGFDVAADIAVDTPIGLGHMTEMRTKLLAAGSESDVAGDAQLDPEKLFYTVQDLANEYMPEDKRNTFGFGPDHTGFTNALMNDRLNLGALQDFEGGSPGAVLNSLMDLAGARPALAAGMRYGITRGKVDMTHESWLGREFTTQTATHGAAPPRPTSRFISFGVVRMTLAPNEAYDNDILAFETRFNTSSSSEESVASDCISSMSGETVSEDSIMDQLGMLEELGNGGGCAGASSNAGSFFGFFTNIMGNAADIIGGPVPTSPTSGRHDQHPIY
jgi:hypothetical protein